MSWLPKLQGGRPADDAEVRLIAHLAVDWLESTGVKPESGRDGNSAFSGLVVRRRMIWNIRGDFGAEFIGSSGSGYAA
jgi:hypothetical protein